MILNISGYLFTPISDIPHKREVLKRELRAQGLKGTILLANEGINCFLAGTREQIDFFKELAFKKLGITPVTFKESWSDTQPFTRMLVKIKKEIIPLGRSEINPALEPAPFVSPKTLKTWLDEGKPVVLLDTRNDYEIRVGTFEGAIDPKIRHFRKFPEAVKELEREIPDLKNKTVVTFCTGGIRCEKAAPLLAKQGYKDVYQLDGGILKYFEECGSSHYQGDCFVFDQRVALNGELKKAEVEQCYKCREPLSAEDQRSPLYVPAVSCPYCINKRVANLA